MSKKKDAVFFAYSFDKTPPPWSLVSDNDVAKWFDNLLKRRWRVLSGKSTQARPIGDKVADAVDESKAIVALFTCKHLIESDKNIFVPSPWVLCECAYAIGRFKYLPHIVAGFREKGVDPEGLALLTIGGMEFPEFERDHLDRDKTVFQNYLNDLEKRIKSGPFGQLSLLKSLPYAQVQLQKIFLIYRNGYGTVQNITQIVIKDPDQFMHDHQGKIKHRIWTHRGTLPPIDEMREVPVHHRKKDPFFHAILDYHRSKRLDTALHVEEEKHNGNDITFSVSFLNPNGESLRLKANDTIRYQYAWGIPEMFPTVEEELEPIKGSEVAQGSYCFAEVEANHGVIEHFQLELRFEREARGGERRELFSKSPFVRIARGFGAQPVWMQSRQMPPIQGEPEEYDMWYEIYRLDQRDFDSRVRVAWRPSSKKYQV